MSRSILATVILSFLVNFSVFSQCDQKGPAIMEAQEKKQAAKTEEEDQEIVILDVTSNKKEKRQLKRFYQEENSKNTKSVLYFNEPSTIKGAGLLSCK